MFPQPILKERVCNLALAFLVKGDDLLLGKGLAHPVYVGRGVKFILLQNIHAGELGYTAHYRLQKP